MFKLNLRLRPEDLTRMGPTAALSVSAVVRRILALRLLKPTVGQQRGGVGRLIMFAASTLALVVLLTLGVGRVPQGADVGRE